MATQCDRVLLFIRRNGSITQDDADRFLGCKRLGARIWDLKKSGIPVESKLEKGVNRFGEPTHYARYSLRKEENQ